MSSHCVPELSSAWHFPVLSPPAEGENSNKEQNRTVDFAGHHQAV